jgi:hypothetical protein
MKCATTSLHYVLSGHPDVFIPDGEIGCLDMDDQEQRAALGVSGLGKRTRQVSEMVCIVFSRCQTRPVAWRGFDNLSCFAEHRGTDG